jgi:hypothetical protein
MRVAGVAKSGRQKVRVPKDLPRLRRYLDSFEGGHQSPITSLAVLDAYGRMARQPCRRRFSWDFC